MFSPATVVSRRFIYTPCSFHAIRVPHSYFTRHIHYTSAIHESLLFYSSKSISTKGERRASVTFSSRFTKHKKATPSTTLSHAGSNKADEVSKNRKNPIHTEQHNRDTKKISLISSDSQRGRYSSQHKPISKMKSSMLPSGQHKSGLHMDGDQFDLDKKSDKNRSAKFDEKSGGIASSLELQKLLSEHNTLRKNYVFKHSETAYASFCSLCLNALKETDILQRLCAGPAVDEENNIDENGGMEAAKELFPESDDAEVLLEVVAEDFSSFTLSVRHSGQVLQWLDSPITLPEIFSSELLHKVTEVGMSSGDGEGTREKAAYSSILQQRWQQHWLHQNPRDFKRIFEDCFGLKSFTSSSTARTDVPTSTMEAPSVFFSSEAASEGSFVRSGKISGVFDLLRTIAFFKWSKDEAMLASYKTKSLDAVQRNTSSHAEESERHSEGSGPPGSFLASHIQVMRTALLNLRAYNKRLEGQNGEAAQGGVTRIVDSIEEHSNLVELLQKHAQTVLDEIPKVDILPKSSFDPSSSSTSLTQRAPTEEEGEKESKDNHVTLTSKTPAYCIHVIDLLFSILFRYMLLQWPFLVDSHQRGTLFRLGTLPWFAHDSTQSMAIWYTFWEIHSFTNASAHSQTLFSSSTNAKPHQWRRGRHHISSDENSEASIAPHGQGSLFLYMQYLRMICSPHVLDWRSATLRHVLGIPSSFNAVSSRADGTYLSKADPKEKSELHTNGLPILRETASIFYGSEIKQRLAFELLYLVLYCLNFIFSITTGNRGRKNSKVDEDIALSRGNSAAYKYLDASSTLCVYVTDMDHFISERFHEKIIRQREWVILSSKLPESSLDETNGKTPVSKAIQNLQQNLLTQSTQPYMLTRQFFQTVLPSGKPWPPIPAKGMKAVWKSVLGAVATPCYHSFASSKVMEGDEMPDKATFILETQATAWRLVYPLLKSFSDEWLQQLFWPLLIGGLKELFPPILHATGVGKVREGEVGAQRAQTSTMGEAKGDNVIRKDLERLLQLGYFGGFLLLALQKGKTSAALEGSQSTTPMPNSSPTGKYGEWAQTLSVEFTAAIHRLINQHPGNSIDLIHYTRPLLSGWLISSSDIEAINTLLTNEDANSATSYISLLHLLNTFVFTTELSNEVREWARKCESLVHHRAQLVHVTDPILTHWYTILHEDNIGLKPLKLSLIGLYRQLWDFFSTRQTAEGVEKKSCNGKIIPSKETDPANDTPIDQPSTEVFCFPSFSINELPIILRFLSTIHARSGLNSLKASFGNIFTSLAGSIIRQLQRTYTLQKQLNAEKNYGSERSLSAQDAAASENAIPTSSINASVSTVQSRIFFIEHSLRSNVQDQLAQLPFSAVLDAWYLGLISRLDIEKVLCGTCQTDTNKNPIKKSQESETFPEAQHRAVEWIKDMSQFKQDLRSSQQARLVAGLLLLREYPFADIDTQSGAANDNTSISHKESQTVMDSGAVRRRGLMTLMQVLLQNLVELEYDDCISGVKPSSHDTNSTSQSSPAVEISQILANSEAETAGGCSMVEYAQKVSRVHAIAAALFLQYGPDSSMCVVMPFCWPHHVPSLQSSEASCKAGDLSCNREHALVLYALFLHALYDTIPGLERGLSEELLLYLVASTYTVQLHYGRELQHLADTHTQSCNSANAVSSVQHLFSAYRSTASGSSPPGETTKSQLPPSTPIVSVLSFIQQVVGQPSPVGLSYPPGILEALSLTMEWGAYLVSQLLPYAEKTLLQQKQRSNTPNLRTLCTSTVAFRGLEAVGLPVAWWTQFPLEQLLQRVAIDRGEMQRHLNYFLITVMCHFKASMALVPAASYIRGRHDFMPLQVLIRILKSILLASSALDPAQVSKYEELDQQREAEPRREAFSSLPSPSISDQYDIDHYEGSTVKGIVYEKRIYTTSSHLSPNYHTSPQLRNLWSVLARCLLTHHTLSAPVEPFLLALHAGASVGCADTRDFEQLLAHVLFADGVAGELPPLATLGLAEWAVILNACATSVWNRPAYTQVLSEPLLNFVILSTQEPFASLRDSSQYCILSEPPRGMDAPTHGLQDSLEKKRQLCIELCHFLESVSTLYMEGDKFWQVFRCMVDAWGEEIRAWKTSDSAPQSSSTTSVMGNDEIKFWTQEWMKSFNWSVRTAGHFGLVIPLEDEGNLEEASITPIGKKDSVS